jgi:AraC-like DNA-binding protein
MTKTFTDSSPTELLRVTGAWTQLLSDWLDQENLIAPTLRAQLDSLRPTDIVPISRWQQLLSEAAALRPERLGQGSAIGLDIGAMVKPRHVGLLGYLVLSCRTLGEAMLAYRRYESLFYGRNLAEVVVREGEAQLRWPADVTTGELADSVSIAGLITFLRRLLEDASRPTPAPGAIDFVFSQPDADTSRRYEDFFRCPVAFGKPFTRVRFPITYMQLLLPHSDSSWRELLDSQAQALLTAIPDADPFTQAVQQTLMQLLPEGKGRLPQIAKALHLSVRTLQRRLDVRQLNWQQLLDQTRMTLANKYLADTSLSLSDTALLLGFSEHSAFSRAFRRWHGQTPRRRRHASAGMVRSGGQAGTIRNR